MFDMKPKCNFDKWQHVLEYTNLVIHEPSRDPEQSLSHDSGTDHMMCFRTSSIGRSVHLKYKIVRTEKQVMYKDSAMVIDLSIF